MKQFALLVFAVTTLISCKRTNNFGYRELICPPYDTTFLSTWLPYQEGDSLNYRDSTGATDNFVIYKVMHEDGDESNGCTPPTECTPSGSIYAYFDDYPTDKLWLRSIHYYNGRGEEHFMLSWNSDKVEIIINSDGTFSLDNSYYDRQEDFGGNIRPKFTHYETLALNEVNYNEVYEIEFNEIVHGNTKRFYLVKEHGIIGYQTIWGRTYWLNK